MEKENKKEQHVHPFDQMMFGNRAGSQPENKQQKEEEQSFNLFETAQTMSETYKQLSPYVKGISDMIKKYKA